MEGGGRKGNVTAPTVGGVRREAFLPCPSYTKGEATSQKAPGQPPVLWLGPLSWSLMPMAQLGCQGPAQPR